MQTVPRRAEVEPEALSDLVDLWSYPLHADGSPALSEIVRRVRAELEDVGCSVLRGFLKPDAVARMSEDAQPLLGEAYYSERWVNAYSTLDDPSFEEDHPRRIFMRRTHGFVPKDVIAPELALRRLYESDVFRGFVATCLGEDEIFEYADPLASLVINVLPEGAEHPWHYDTNEFIVSTLLQHGDGGGAFEYCPQIRNPHSENYERVGRVLRDEDRSEVQTLHLEAGDLQLFKGRFTLHRVSEVRSKTPRLTGILSYAKEPGLIGQLERTRQLFGRVTDAHRAAEGLRPRADGLVD